MNTGKVMTISRFFKEYQRKYPDSSLTERQLRIAAKNGDLRCARSGRLFLVTEESFLRWISGEDNK